MCFDLFGADHDQHVVHPAAPATVVPGGLVANPAGLVAPVVPGELVDPQLPGGIHRAVDQTILATLDICIRREQVFSYNFMFGIL